MSLANKKYPHYYTDDAITFGEIFYPAKKLYANTAEVLYMNSSTTEDIDARMKEIH